MNVRSKVAFCTSLPTIDYQKKRRTCHKQGHQRDAIHQYHQYHQYHHSQRACIHQQKQQSQTPTSNTNAIPTSETFTPIAFVVSHFEAHDLLKLKSQAPTSDTTKVINGPFSTNLGLSTIPDITISCEGICLSTSSKLVATWKELQKMTKKNRAGAFEMFSDGNTEPCRISGMSTTTSLCGSLLPTTRTFPPTLILSGFTMHRITNTNPLKDTNEKIKAAKPKGTVLDICTGLGYTAIAMSELKGVEKVISIERDELVMDIQKRNPWSAKLFNNCKIELLKGDAMDILVNTFGDSAEIFDTVVHDPPAKVISGQLYGLEFYQNVYRICKFGASLFHYIGDPNSKESGRLYHGVINRLAQAGFVNIGIAKDAFGVVAHKMKS